MGSIDSKSVRRRIEEVALRHAEFPESVALEVAFHMTEWLEVLEAYNRFCSRPEALSDEEVSELLIDFLIRVPNHVAAAAKLYTFLPVTDVWGVDATSEDDEELVALISWIRRRKKLAGLVSWTRHR